MVTSGVHLGIKVEQAKSQFFDPLLIKSPLEKAEDRFLNRAGATIRLTARRSIRKSRKTAAAGRPPRSHAGLVKQLLFYVKDPAGDGVIIGPAKLNSAKDRDTVFLLEHGGQRRVRRGYWYTAGGGKQARNYRGRFTKGSGQRKFVPAGTLQHYEPHPFMGPALKKTEPKLAQFWDRAIN